MGRRTSGQQVGLQSIGNVQANANTLTTTQTNQNLTIAPNGTGTVAVQSSTTITGDLSISNQGDLRLLEASGNGTNYIALQAAANMAANYTLTWPAAASSTNGFVLTSQTDGTLSWASAGGNIPVSDPGSVATVHYPLFGTNAGSLPTTLSPLARSNLSFVPSTGDLNAPILSGGSANSATLTLRGTSSTTKATASVLMNENITSTSATTGTLVVTGGVGIGGALNTTAKITTIHSAASDLTNSSANLEVQDNGATSRPTISFHRPGIFASKITFNTDNAYYFGGWSAGAGASPIVCGGVNPGANNTYDLGTTSLRWRNIYTQDLHLSNGVGDYTVVEGEENLYLVNNKTNKSFKFALIEVDASEVPPKSQT
jgi:hypothetical protein